MFSHTLLCRSLIPRGLPGSCRNTHSYKHKHIVRECNSHTLLLRKTEGSTLTSLRTVLRFPEESRKSPFGPMTTTSYPASCPCVSIARAQRNPPISDVITLNNVIKQGHCVSLSALLMMHLPILFLAAFVRDCFSSGTHLFTTTSIRLWAKSTGSSLSFFIVRGLNMLKKTQSCQVPYSLCFLSLLDSLPTGSLACIFTTSNPHFSFWYLFPRWLVQYFTLLPTSLKYVQKKSSLLCFKQCMPTYYWEKGA